MTFEEVEKFMSEFTEADSEITSDSKLQPDNNPAALKKKHSYHHKFDFQSQGNPL
jgi:hypothetical protein